MRSATTIRRWPPVRSSDVTGSSLRLGRLLVVAIALVVPGLVATAADALDEGATATWASTTGRLMVEVRADDTQVVAGATEGTAIGSGWVVVDPGDRATAEVAAELRARRDVVAVRPEVWFTAAVVPNDPCFDDALACEVSADQAYLSRIGAPRAWDVTTGSADVVVAVLDSGVRATHEDAAEEVLDWSDCGVTEAPDGFFCSLIEHFVGALGADDELP